ncbi:MAG TPA: hypothetical protein EYN66_02365 [Myxococcales bacterium]|nr:hypothetical protein [Myxococcales bacterium]
MFSTLSRFFMSALFVVSLLTACTGGDPSGNGNGNTPVSINTIVTPQIVLLGQPFVVSCPVFNSLGGPLSVATTFAISPEIEHSDSQVTPTQVGNYTVTCRAEDVSLTDSTPAVVYVIDPNNKELVTVDTSLSTNVAAIGQEVTASCQVVYDGQQLSDINTVIETTPQAGITIDGFTLVGQINENYGVACRVTGSEFVDLTPAPLSVGQGGTQPDKIVTTLSSNTAKAGEEVLVTCTVYDASGQTIDRPTMVSAPAAVKVNGQYVSSNQVGTYNILCNLAEDGPLPELVSANLTVETSGPASLDAFVEPAKAAYKPGHTITIKWSVVDAHGNTVEPAPAATVTAPLTGTEAKGNNKYKLLEDGTLSFKVALNGNPQISDTVEVIVDGAGPIVTIISPDRGTTRDGNAAVTVTGTVWDQFGGVESLSINNYPVNWDAQGNWSFTINSGQGLNAVEAIATDIHGNTGKATVAWYYSTEWVPMDSTNPDASYLDNAVRVWLSQEMIDDNDHTAPIDDIAHILEILLTNVNLNQLIGKPVLYEQNYPGVVAWEDPVEDTSLTGDAKLWAEISSISFGTTKLNLKSRNGGMDMTASFMPQGAQPGLSIEIDVHVQLTLDAKAIIDSPVCSELTASIQPPPELLTTATLTIDEFNMDSSFDISMSVGGELKVIGQKLLLSPKGINLSPLADAKINLGKLEFKICGIIPIPIEIDFGTIDLNNLVGGFDQLFGGLISTIMDTFVPVATQVLEPLIAVIGGDAIKAALKSLEIDQTVPMPEMVPGQTMGEINIKAKIAQVEFTSAGATLGLDGLSSSEKTIERNPLGSILRAQCLGNDKGPYQLPKMGDMEFALSIDLLNEVLFSLWYNGGINMILDANELADLSTFNVKKAELTLNPYLPPIISDCNSKGTLKVQLGDSYVEADVTLGELPISLKAWVTAEIDVGLAAEGNELKVVVNGVSLFNIEVLNLSGPLEGMEESIAELFETVLLDKLLAELTNNAIGKFPLPEFDLSGLAPGIPADSKISLNNLGITKKKGFLQIEGSLK